MRDVLAGHTILALDTCIWIYHLEDHPRYRSLTGALLAEVEAGRYQAVVSEISLLELLVQPFRLDLPDVADEYETLLDHFPNLSIIPISREIILQAASLRAAYNFRSPDALIIATGILHGATLLLTNDKKWKKMQEIKAVCLDDLLPPV